MTKLINEAFAVSPHTAVCNNKQFEVDGDNLMCDGEIVAPASIIESAIAEFDVGYYNGSYYIWYKAKNSIYGLIRKLHDPSYTSLNDIITMKFFPSHMCHAVRSSTCPDAISIFATSKASIDNPKKIRDVMVSNIYRVGIIFAMTNLGAVRAHLVDHSRITSLSNIGVLINRPKKKEVTVFEGMDGGTIEIKDGMIYMPNQFILHEAPNVRSVTVVDGVVYWSDNCGGIYKATKKSNTRLAILPDTNIVLSSTGTFLKIKTANSTFLYNVTN